MRKNRLAFTLPEILITLGIIGIIASITIPTLVQDIQNAELKAALKENYSNIDQATRRIIADFGGNVKGVFTSSTVMRDLYLKYLNYTKSCTNSSAEGCWHQANTWKTYKNLSRDAISTSGAVLSNGTLVFFANMSINCTASCGNFDRCANMYFDINGFKGPNTIGKDIYLANVLERTLKPGGITGDCDNNNCGSSATSSIYAGSGCAAWVLKNQEY